MIDRDLFLTVTKMKTINSVEKVVIGTILGLLRNLAILLDLGLVGVRPIHYAI